MAKSLNDRRVWNGVWMLFAIALLAAGLREAPVVASVSPAAATPVARASLAAETLAASAPAVAQASAATFAIRGYLDLDGRLDHGDYAWNEEGAPAGPIAIVVDLKAQVLYVYRGGIEIGRSAILYGADDKPTPTGTFPILEKDADHVSNLYGAPMPYMLRLTRDGIAIHGSKVEYGSATHGCVGVPDEFAQMLFARARIGDRVLITRGWRTDIYPG